MRSELSLLLFFEWCPKFLLVLCSVVLSWLSGLSGILVMDYADCFAPAKISIDYVSLARVWW